tara:strand:- start:163 stop:1098 length:936 start_codon:yes stop_codon:yes gene_type:complete
MDRWYARGESSLGVFNLIQQDISSEGQGAPHALKVAVTTNVTPGSGDVYKIAQRIEGKNIGHLSYGTSNAKTITLSFIVKSSVTGTHGGSLMNSAQNRAYPFTYTISSADTWEQKSITIPGDTGGTWVINNGIGLELNFDMGSGSGKRGSAGSWIGSRAEGATGAVQVISSANATWFISKVQLEVGSVATDFEHRSFGQELQLCKRYYQQINQESSSTSILTAFGNGSGRLRGLIYLPVEMRANPTVSLDVSGGNPSFYSYTASPPSFASLSGVESTKKNIIVDVNVSSVTAGAPYDWRGSGAFITINAEL